MTKVKPTLIQVRSFYILTTLFLVALSFYTFFQIKSLISSSEWINHTNKVNTTLEKVSNAFINALSNQKSYLVTGDSAMILARDADFSNIEQQLNILDSLTVDNPEQSANLITLRKVIAEKKENLNMLLETYKPLNISPDLSNSLTNALQKTEIVKQEIDKMSATETKLLEQRNKSYTELSAVTPLFIISLSLGALLILLGFYVRLNNVIHELEDVHEKLDASNKELALKNIELQKTGEQFLQMFDNNPVALTFGEISSDKIVYANNYFYTIFGYSPKEVIGHTAEELNLVSPEETARLLPIIMGHLEEDRTLEELQGLPAEERADLLLKLREKMFQNGFEVTYTRKNGSNFFAIVFYEVIDIGNVKYALTSYVDITERKEALQQIEDQRAFADLIIASDPAMVFATDENLNITVWNKKIEAHSGLKKEETIGKNILTIYPEYDNDQWNRILSSVLHDGKSLHFSKVEFQRARGFGESWIIPLRNSLQQIIGILGITRDITETTEMNLRLEKINADLEKINEELNKTAATLQKSEERFNRMVTEVEDYAILFLSKDGKVENWNEGAEKIKGYKADEIIGIHFSQFYTEADKKDNLPQQLLNEATQAGKAIHEGWRVRKDGSKFWGNTVITALHDNQDNIIGFSKVTRDLSDKKNAEDIILAAFRELEVKNKELEKSNKELESFNYISSHDLQEPLRQIQIFASRFSDTELQNLSETGRTYFNKIYNAAKRMQNLISDLLAYSRTRTEERQYKLVKLNPLINEIEEEFAETIAEKQATIETGDLGEVYVIPFQFRQLLYNLIGNALKFAKQDLPVRINISNEIVNAQQVPDVNPDSTAQYYHIRLSDNGIGFEPQYNQRIFEVFQRLHDHQKIAGTGMGLAIAKTIVDNHQGIIKASGELDKGAIFDIYIPIKQK